MYFSTFDPVFLHPRTLLFQRFNQVRVLRDVGVEGVEERL